MNNSKLLFAEAKKYLPGGVNSPVRSFYGVTGDPIFFKSGKGAYLTDADGRQFLDYVCSWGPLILGHAHPHVIAKVSETLQQGLGFGASTEIEVKLAKKVCELMPTIEMVRFVSSGTEAAMTAIRVARGFTKRNKIIKFAGCYHGHADSLLVSAGSGALTLGIPSSAGIPDAVAQETLVAEFNRLDEVKALFARYGNEIAAVILEPVAANMNLILPNDGFLAGLRQLCDEYKSLLIYDEVITGFRIAKGGATAHYGVQPDLIVLGKIVGGGLPAAAFGGKAEIMRTLAPLGPVYQAGTLSGNPLAMAAGLATLELLEMPEFYDDLSAKSRTLTEGLERTAKRAGVALQTRHIGGAFGLFFTESATIESEGDVKRCDLQLFKRFFHGMLSEGIYFAPSAFEIGFISASHTEEDIQRTIHIASKVFTDLATKQFDFPLNGGV
ncbi:MAG: glutamate-1-semialdehyde 2,1-aminomutase [Gammaproteobacteria bacterium]|nr:glutamate-1-semialdehyde 2,1-aminomutase [Gammaproteobacteria bacterium]